MANVSSTEKWTKKMESILIDEVHVRQPLWNITNPHYKKKGLKKYLYKEIEDVLKEMFPAHDSLFTTDTIQYKFNTLRTYFKRENKKTKCLENGAVQGFTPTWEHFIHLSFLDDSISEPSCSISNLSGESEMILPNNVREDYLREDFLSSSQSDIYSQSFSTSTPNPPRPSKKLRICSSNEEDRKKKFEILENIDKHSDGDELYCAYLATLLRRFQNFDKKERCKLEIQKLILDALSE